MNKIVGYKYLEPEDIVQELDEVINVTRDEYIKVSHLFFGVKYGKATNRNLRLWKALKPRRPIFKRKIG